MHENKNLKLIAKTLAKLYPENKYHIFYCPEPFDQFTDQVETKVIGKSTIIFKVYPSLDGEKQTVRFTDKPNSFLGFKSAVFLINDPKV